MRIIEDIYEKLIKRKILKPTDVVGCSEAEIREVENKFKIKLPSLYRDFIEVFGRSAGDFLKGTDIFYDKIFFLREYAQELLDEDNNSYQIDDTTFVFAMHQGYQFMFFNLNENEEDPAVYYYCEGMDNPQKKWENFSSFLYKSLEDYES